MTMKINEKNLCVFATNPPFDCEGFLNKRGEGNKAFLRRYFVLKGNLLFYFEKKGDKEPLGLIIVEGCTIELSEESDQYCFEIAFNGNRTYVLSADSQESMERWMKALTCAGYEFKKIMVAELQRKLDEIEGTRQKMLAESQTSLISVPKPPPRRQNPFNRAAPPIPGTHGNVNVNGSAIVELLATNSNNNMPLRSKTGNNADSENGVGSLLRSDFYVPRRPRPPAIQVRDDGCYLLITYFGNFMQNHEKFRENVMKDVLEYQEQRKLKENPLIDL